MVEVYSLSTGDGKHQHFVLVFHLVEEVFHEMLLLQPPTHTRENENENVNANAAWVSVSVHGNSIAVFQKELRVNRSIYMGDERVQYCIDMDKIFTSMSSTGNARSMGICLYGFSRNDELVLEHHIRWLISWNPDSQKIKNLEISSSIILLLVFMPRV